MTRSHHHSLSISIWVSAEPEATKIPEPEINEADATSAGTSESDIAVSGVPEGECTGPGQQPWQRDVRTIVLLAISCFLGIIIMVLIAYVHSIKKKKEMGAG